jgi:predicted nucleic acid-binding protein
VRFLLDTNVVIYLLGGRLQHALPQGVHGVSIISEIELLSHPAFHQMTSRLCAAF